MKTCTKCGAEKPMDDFEADARYRDGRRPWCRECRRAAAREYHRTRRKLYRYSLSQEDFASISRHDNCPICHSPFDADPRSKRGRVIDHDHSSGSVRGVICRSCNLMLGYAGDNIAALDRGAAYLAGCLAGSNHSAQEEA